MKLKLPKSVNIKAAFVTGSFIIIASIISIKPWECNKPKYREITIRLIDKNLGLGIENACVKINPMNIDSLTDNMGYFTFRIDKKFKSELTIRISKEKWNSRCIKISPDSLFGIKIIYLERLKVYDSILLEP